jgi:GAF domain-containing protein
VRGAHTVRPRAGAHAAARAHPRDAHAAAQAHVTPEVLTASTWGPEHRRLVEALAPTSWVNLPLVSRNQALGAIAVGSSRASRHYGKRDQRYLVELAQLVALALDGARLHAALEQAVQARDRVLGWSRTICATHST